jgi:hypothetical protein
MVALASLRPSLLLRGLLLLCIAWQTSQLAAAAAVNLLDNPSLAANSGHAVNVNGGNISGTLPASWWDNTEWAGPNIAIRYSLLSGAAACGAGITGGCIKAAVSKGFMQMGQFLEAPAGANYRLSLKLRAPTSAGLPVQLQLRQTGEPYIAYGQALTAAGAGWMQLEIAFAHVPSTAANAGSKNAPIFFVIVSGGPGTLFLAEPVLVALPPGTAAPVVQLAPPAGAVPRAFFCLNTNHDFDSDSGVLPLVGTLLVGHASLQCSCGCPPPLQTMPCRPFNSTRPAVPAFTLNRRPHSTLLSLTAQRLATCGPPWILARGAPGTLAWCGPQSSRWAGGSLTGPAWTPL